VTIQTNANLHRSHTFNVRRTEDICRTYEREKGSSQQIKNQLKQNQMRLLIKKNEEQMPSQISNDNETNKFINWKKTSGGRNRIKPTMRDEK